MTAGRRVALVAAIVVVAALAAAAGRQVAAHKDERIARALTGGDPDRAPALIRRYGCGGCHTISGIPGADGKTGASLEDLRARVYIGGGTIRNDPESLVRWIVAPQTIEPASAMPATGIDEREARDVAAYLYAH